jgi:hypothetical protein
VDGKRIKLHPKSPLLRGQDSIVMQELITGAGQLNAIFGAGTAGMLFRLEDTSLEVFRRNGIPTRLLKTPDELKGDGANAGAAAAQAAAPGGPAAGTDPMALLAPVMQAASK